MLRNAQAGWRRQSVSFNRQGQAPAQTLTQPEPHGCLAQCGQGFRAILISVCSRWPGQWGDSHGGEIYSQPQSLQKLPPVRQWPYLSTEEKGRISLAVASTAKEGVPDWVNQDSYIACALVAAQKPGGHKAQNGKGADGAQHLLFGVCDGHGGLGHKVSQLVADRLPCHLNAKPGFAADPGRALDTAVKQADLDVYRHLARDAEYNGSTAAVVFVDTQQRVLTCANVGDSRVVLGRLSSEAGEPSWESVPLTDDIKPQLPEEKHRIEMSGGVVSPARLDGVFIGPNRVWEDWSLTKPGLAMGRSIGDACGRKVGVVPDPKLSIHKLQPNDTFIIIASDGLWDVLTNDEVVAIAARHVESPQAAPVALIQAARQAQEGELEDDTTIVMVVFR